MPKCGAEKWAAYVDERKRFIDSIRQLEVSERLQLFREFIAQKSPLTNAQRLENLKSALQDDKQTI